MLSTRLIRRIILYLGFTIFPMPIFAAVATGEAPVETVKKIGDKLIRETPFSYRLGLSREGHAFDGLKSVDFSRTFGSLNGIAAHPRVAYAFTTLTAPCDTTLTVQVAHAGSCRVWCEGKEVYSRDSDSPLSYVTDERSVELPYAFSLYLKKGRNNLLLKTAYAGTGWRILLQPPSFLDAVLNHTPLRIGFGLQGLDFVTSDVAALSPWLVIGPFNGDINTVFAPEKEMKIGKVYAGADGAPVAWTIPHKEVLGEMIDPAPWGTTYQWNYHNGGVALAMQSLAEYTLQEKYNRWANNFCDFHLEGIPFVDYQANTLMAFSSANARILDCPLLDFTLAPSLPFIHRLIRDKQFDGDGKYREFVDRMLGYASTQVKSPGMNNYARVTPEKYTVWVDDMFMGIPFLMKAARYSTDESRAAAYRDEAAAQILDFNRHVWDKAARLYMHANYSSRPHVKLPHWSRANGWGLWAMSEVLEGLPAAHPLYKKILAHFRTHAASLKELQSECGLWHNVLDRTDSPLETSGSAIFVMAMARGVREGWLPAREYLPVIEKGWEGISSRIEDNGTIHDICVGTMCSTDEEYYVNRPFYDNDTHGSFAVMFCGIEVQKLLDKLAENVADTRFTPVKPCREEVDMIRRDLERQHPNYDPEAHMLKTVTTDSHYHSDLPGGVTVHQTRESLEYAVALLKTGDKELTARALDIIRTILPMQERDATKPYCGVWPYYPEDPLSGRKAPVDYNWADFMAVPLIDVVTNHADILDLDLKEEIGKSLVLAANAIKRRDVQPDYTNIIIMGTYVCYAVGDIYHIGSLKTYAQARLRKFHKYTKATKGFTEYNSPTYTVVALNELLKLRCCMVNSGDLAIINDLYENAWAMIGRHFHGPSGQWCGPNLRSYSDLATDDVRRLFFNASDGAINLPGDYPRYPNVLSPHAIPEKAMREFTRASFPRLENDTLVAALPRSFTRFVQHGKIDSIATADIVGRLYMTPSYALASVNQSYMWNQTRPLIAHFGKADNPGYMRVRFLHDGYDFSAVNIYSAQDSTTVLSVFNISCDGGDRHPSIDKLRDCRFEASDLRLRIELGGSAAGSAIRLPGRPAGAVSVDAGTVALGATVPYLAWHNEIAGRWELGGDDKTTWADYVIYNGKKRIFDLANGDDVVLGLCLKIADNRGISPVVPNVNSSVEGDYLTLSTGDLKVKALRKCGPMGRMHNDFAVVCD